MVDRVDRPLFSVVVGLSDRSIQNDFIKRVKPQGAGGGPRSRTLIIGLMDLLASDKLKFSNKLII